MFFASKTFEMKTLKHIEINAQGQPSDWKEAFYWDCHAERDATFTSGINIVIYLLAARKFQRYLYDNSQLIQSSISSGCTFAKMQYLQHSLSKIAPAGRQF